MRVQELTSNGIYLTNRTQINIPKIMLENVVSLFLPMDVTCM